MKVFWKYDQFPFCLSGTLAGQLKEDFVGVNEHGKFIRRESVLAVLDDDKGAEVANRLGELEAEYKGKKAALLSEYMRKAKEAADFL